MEPDPEIVEAAEDGRWVGGVRLKAGTIGIANRRVVFTWSGGG